MHLWPGSNRLRGTQWRCAPFLVWTLGISIYHGQKGLNSLSSSSPSPSGKCGTHMLGLCTMVLGHTHSVCLSLSFTFALALNHKHALAVTFELTGTITLWVIHSIKYSPSPFCSSLSHALALSLASSLTHPFTCSLTHSLAHSLAFLFVRTLAHPLTHSHSLCVVLSSCVCSGTWSFSESLIHCHSEAECDCTACTGDLTAKRVGRQCSKKTFRAGKCTFMNVRTLRFSHNDDTELFREEKDGYRCSVREKQRLVQLIDHVLSRVVIHLAPRFVLLPYIIV